MPDPAKRREDQLYALSEEVNRIASTLAKLSTGSIGDSMQYAISHGTGSLSSKTVASALRARRLREKYFAPDLFADPAWDIMLHLLHAELKQIRVTVSDACYAAAVPMTTGLRWIKMMAGQDLLLRRPDPLDARRVFLELTEDTSTRLRHYFVALAEAGLA